MTLPFTRRGPSWLRLVAVIVAIGIASMLLYYAGWAFFFDLKKVREMPLTTQIYDRNGVLLQQVYQENRIILSADQIPQVMRDAVVATEDQRFYHHLGVDPISIARAAFGNLLHSHISSGASTITQQLARNSAGMSERTLGRKLKEVFLALRIEMVYSKQQILTFYLNRIFFGSHFYGIGAASEAYFGREPKDLTLSQAAMLAGIISGPNSFSPWHNPKKAQQAKARALTRMQERGYITTDQMQSALNEPLVLRPLQQITGSHAAEEAQEEATQLLSPEALMKGGVKIYTTIDLAFQRTAEAELEKHLASIEADPDYRHVTRAQFLQNGSEKENGMVPYLQGAFVAISNADGGILAMVGGRNYEESRFNRATQAARQVGSTMKPFVYANAFNTLNITALTRVDHSKFDLRHADQPDAVQSAAPEYISVRQAIEESDNYAAVRTVLASGVDSFAYLFQQASDVAVPVYPSSALGACSVTPLQLTAAFSIFPNYGVKIKPYLIQKIVTADDQVIYQHIDERHPVLSPQIAFQIANLLQGVIDHGTGRVVRELGLQGDLGGKTGTTNDFKDSWFVGFSSEVTAGAWIGFDLPVEVMPGGFASRLAAPVWGKIMKVADDHYLPRPLAPPTGVSLGQNVTTQHTLFFSQQIPTGAAEYIRDDQRDGYLTQIGGNQTSAPISVASGEGIFGWMKRKFDEMTQSTANPDAGSVDLPAETAPRPALANPARETP